MGKELEKINTDLAAKDAEVQDYLRSLPESMDERSDEQKAKLAKLMDEHKILSEKRETTRAAEHQEAEFRARSAEFNAQKPGQTPGTEITRAVGSGTEVADKPVYGQRFGLGQQVVDAWNVEMGRDVRGEAKRRLEKMENRRQFIRNMYVSRADYPTQQEAVVSKGGIFLETERSFELMTHGFNNGVLASKCRRMSMGGAVAMHEIYGFWENSRKDGDRFAGLRFVPIEELEEVVRQAMDFQNLFRIQPRKVGAGFNMSEELARDVPMVESIIMDLFKNSWARDVDWYIMNANGGKEPGVGIMNAKALLTIPKESGQAANSLVNENILNMQMHMPAGSWGGAIWVFNQFHWGNLHGLYFPTGDDGELSRLFRPSATATGESVIGNRPAIPIEHIQPIGRAGDIAFIDLNYMLLTDKGGMRTGSSVEVEFWSGQKSVKLTTEIDIQPLYKDKVQVYADEPGLEKYVSPFIVLAERK